MMQLNNVYQRDDFIKFLEEDFLTDFKRDIRPVNTSSLTCINKAQYLGESKTLDLQVFEFVFEGSANKRVTLTKDAFSVMRSSAIYNTLAVFHTEDDKDWRFSLLTATPEPTEKGKVSLTYSNPKRLSFFLGPNAKVNTPTKFLISKGKIVDFDDLKSRFSIEVVNKEFYKEISQAFTKLVSGLLKLPSIQDKSQTNLEFAVRLIGRIIFCWFLREKKSDAGLSLMPKELLSIEAVKEYKDYYHTILEPIFFEVLNKPVKSRRDEFAKGSFSSVPYLNGGLFSPQEDDFYKRMNGDFQSQFHNTLVIPDTWLNSFFEILETYNFTIDENTSYDEELSIDPEMLGRIFENLLAEINPETGESARKSTGSYYTPRTIVNYMVDESLLLYLKEQTGIKEEKLRAIISYDLSDDSENPVSTEEKEKIIEALEKVKILDPACGSGAFPIGALQKIVFILQQTDPDGQLWFKKQIKKTAPEVKRVIEREFEHKNFDYIRKLGIIRENIYGVDIQAIATEISRLRCFLTLIVDERIQDGVENRGIEPLPNLDFKFVTANSLIGLPQIDTNQQELFDDNAKIEELKSLRDQYFSSKNDERKDLMVSFSELQSEMINELIDKHSFTGVIKAELTRKLADWKPFKHKSTEWFDPEWMFGIKNGFDIVIANPPYVGEKGHKDLFKEIRKSTLGGFYLGKIDLFYFFFHFAINQCNDNGIVSFITTNYYPTATGGIKLRNDFKQRTEIRRMVNFNELKIFESAKGQHNMITILQKSRDENSVALTSITHRSGTGSEEILQQILNRVDSESEYYDISQHDLYDGKELYIRLNGVNAKSDDPINNILRKVSDGNVLLEDLCNVNIGMRTGADKVTENYINTYKLNLSKGEGIYVLTDDEKKNLELNDFEEQMFIPFFKNSDIRRYYCKTINTLWLLDLTFPKYKDIDFEKIPQIYKHIKKYKNILEKRRSNDNGLLSVIKGGYWWCYTMRQLDFSSEKIVAPQRSPKNTFAFNDVTWVASMDVYFITQKDLSMNLRYIISILNSKLYYLWLYNRGKRKGEILELYQKPLSEIPIKKIPLDEQKPFINIVDKILLLTKAADYLENIESQTKVKGYENEIDQMVYKLYELTNKEIIIVENFSH